MIFNWFKFLCCKLTKKTEEGSLVECLKLQVSGSNFRVQSSGFKVPSPPASSKEIVLAGMTKSGRFKASF